MHDPTGYIVLCIKEAASTTRDGAESILAEHDAIKRAEVLRYAADAVARFTGNDLDANAKMLRRMADAAAGGDGDA